MTGVLIIIKSRKRADIVTGSSPAGPTSPSKGIANLVSDVPRALRIEGLPSGQMRPI